MDRYEVTKKILFLSGVTMYLIEKIEEIENYNTVYNKKLKQVGKNFLCELDKKIDRVYFQADQVATDQGNNLNDEINHVLESLRLEYSKITDNEMGKHEQSS